MTSRRALPSDREGDALNALIRCALRERLVEKAPSPAVWGSIGSSARRLGKLWQVWRQVTYRFETLGILLSNADTAFAMRDGWDPSWGYDRSIRYDPHWSRVSRLLVLRLVA